jgi:hypothetical protein
MFLKIIWSWRLDMELQMFSTKKAGYSSASSDICTVGYSGRSIVRLLSNFDLGTPFIPDSRKSLEWNWTVFGIQSGS